MRAGPIALRWMNWQEYSVPPSRLWLKKSGLVKIVFGDILRLIILVRSNGHLMLQIHGEVDQLQQAVAESRAEIEELKKSLQRVDGKIDDLGANIKSMENRFQSFRDEFRAIAQQLTGGASGAVSALQYIVDEEAKKLWADYFPQDDVVKWAEFEKALTAEHGGLSEASLKSLQQELDIDGDGRVHVRELNIFTKKFGLAASVRRLAAASDSEDADGKTALYRAARANDAGEVRRLLAARADPTTASATAAPRRCTPPPTTASPTSPTRCCAPARGPTCPTITG